jgi:hypothetical protein
MMRRLSIFDNCKTDTNKKRLNIKLKLKSCKSKYAKCGRNMLGKIKYWEKRWPTLKYICKITLKDRKKH